MAARKKRASRKPASRQLTAAQILSAKDCEPVKVPCPEWGGFIYVRPMTGAERDEFDQDQYRSIQAGGGDLADNLKNLRARTVASSACKADGTRLFTMAQVEVLGAKNGAALDRCYDAARGLNRLSDKDLEELSGN